MIIKKPRLRGSLSFDAEREVIELSTLRRCISISYKGFDSQLTELRTFSFAIYNANVKVRKEAFKKIVVAENRISTNMKILICSTLLSD